MKWNQNTHASSLNTVSIYSSYRSLAVWGQSASTQGLETSNSQNKNHDGAGLHGCYSMSTGKQPMTFRNERNVSISTVRQTLRNAGNY